MIPCAHCHFYADNMDQLVVHMKLVHKTQKAFWMSRLENGRLCIDSEINPSPEKVPFRLEQMNLDAIIDLTQKPGKIVYLKGKAPEKAQNQPSTSTAISTPIPTSAPTSNSAPISTSAPASTSTWADFGQLTRTKICC